MGLCETKSDKVQRGEVTSAHKEKLPDAQQLPKKGQAVLGSRHLPVPRGI